jgi:hypothetical protein
VVSRSNLGSIHLREKNPQYAMTAYGEALKHLRGEGRIWENYLLACMQSGNFQKVVCICGVHLVVGCMHSL